MPTKGPGLYEALITEAVRAELAGLDGVLVKQDALNAAEAPDRLALHVARVVERVLRGIQDTERVGRGVALARDLVLHAAKVHPEGGAGLEVPLEPAQVLRHVAGRRVDGTPEPPPQPLTPLLDTTLLTNAPGEPRVGAQVLAEIGSADRIDLVMAFIRRTGIAPLLDALKRHVSAGRPLRILTTTYTGSTEAAALDALQSIGAQVRVSYDESSTRLHAKAWLFHRDSGMSTAFVGSSNLTHSAQVNGLEWNVRISGARNPSVIEKMSAVFESYWKSGDKDSGTSRDFVPYVREEFLSRMKEDDKQEDEVVLSPLEIRLEPFQERLLEQLQLARWQGHHRNLLVSATGTGKTVMAAVDYARLRNTLPSARLLFVAHRAEILKKSRATFRHALRDAAFGELWVDGERPAVFEHVFASIQSLQANGWEDFPRNHFDVVIVDEFHHAAAKSYRQLLSHVAPRQLLALTATPERADGHSVLDWFEGRIAAELRLWDAIDQHRLVPFSYFGIHDGLDLRDIPWKRGRGYDVEGLSNLYTGNDSWARLVLKELTARVDVSRMRALGFCVSVSHARFMARVFSEHGVAARAVWADTPTEEREDALKALSAGTVKVVFSVDLFNEGVDVPSVDTLLLLRPTDSSTLFLQQLGRGLRRSVGKANCTVLDFVGQHRREFRFERRLGALVRGTRRLLAQQVKEGFPFLPAGCHVELDRVATDVVLESIRCAIPSNWTSKVHELKALSAPGSHPTLSRYLEETGLELEELYAGGHGWSELCEAAGLEVAPAGPHEESLRSACGRLLHVDDPFRIERWRSWLTQDSPPSWASLPVVEQRLLRMLVATLVNTVVPKDATLEQGCSLLWDHPQIRREVTEVLGVLRGKLSHDATRVHELPDIPLAVHARYSRLEILSACGVGSGARVAPWQTGVRWVPEARLDLLAFTLDKTSGRFSPTTRYRDYAISREFIHWESQSMTRADGETGRRYREHAARGSGVLLFARSRDNERFYYLGPATYEGHKGELPMAITWRLKRLLPGDLFAEFAAAVA
jgi:superfamily II DNA or RNA helicase/HKD family nuclease